MICIQLLSENVFVFICYVTELSLCRQSVRDKCLTGRDCSLSKVLLHLCIRIHNQPLFCQTRQILQQVRDKRQISALRNLVSTPD